MSAPMQCIFPLTNQEYFQFENGFKFIDQHLLQNNKVLFSGKFQWYVDCKFTLARFKMILFLIEFQLLLEL